jgi:hypothetical protein
MMGRSAHALAVIHLPVRPGAMDPSDAVDLAVALQEVGRSIASGYNAGTGTVIVPYQERTSMKVALNLSGPGGAMFEFDMKYHRLPPEYVAEIAAVAKSYASFIENAATEAGSGPSYAVTFSYEAEGEELEGTSGAMAAVLKGKVAKRGLLYSKAVELQDAGVLLLQQLQTGAHREIKSGQRK